jgi:hypothetical protein
MSNGESSEGRRVRTATTRVAVEAAIDFSKGANRDTWMVYRSKMSGSISPWRSGGFLIEERFSDTTDEI